MPTKKAAPNIIQFPSVAQEKEKKKPRRRNLRDDGRYCVRVNVIENGKKKQVPFYSRISKADAKAQADAFKKQIGLGLKMEDRDITVEQWAERWIAANSKGKSFGRISNYQTAKKFLCNRIGNKPIRTVTELDLRSAVGDLDGFSESHINKAVWFIQAIFKSAFRNHIIPFDPAVFVEKPQGTYEGHRSLESWEIDLIIDNWRGRRAGIWMMAMMFAGLRRSEAFAATLTSFDPATNQWRVEYSAHHEHNRLVDSPKKRGKTDKAKRSIQIYDPLRSALKEDFEAHPRTHFVVNADGTRITESGFRRAWNQMLLYLEKVANGLTPDKYFPKKFERPADWKAVHFTPHDLRYTFATFLYDAGVDEKTAQIWMGHESPEMTRDLYAQLTAERQARSDQNYGRYLKRFVLDPASSDGLASEKNEMSGAKSVTESVKP